MNRTKFWVEFHVSGYTVWEYFVIHKYSHFQKNHVKNLMSKQTIFVMPGDIVVHFMLIHHYVTRQNQS